MASIYRAEELAEGKRQVLIVGHPEDADAVASAIPGLAVVSWSGDRRLVDWSPLAGRRVVIWEDNDPDEAIECSEVASRVFLAKPKSLKVIPRPGSEKMWGWGLLDAIKSDGWTQDEIVTYAKDRAVDWTIGHYLQLLGERRAPRVDDIDAELSRRGV